VSEFSRGPSHEAAMGAVVSGIFGMNLQSRLEMSVTGFYLATFLIVTGCSAVFKLIMNFARRQKIL
jgi:magnesium transporter